MDVNALLESLRYEVQQALELVYSSSTEETPAIGSLRTIAEQVDNLDVHLSRGGFLPSAWVPESRRFA